MQNLTVITSGKTYADIDVIACISAYKQYLDLLGQNPIAVTTGPWNQTVPATIRTWPISIDKIFTKDPSLYDFTLVDISNPAYLEDFVILEQVTEVFDHHHGYEPFWKERIAEKTHIEPVGACATLIWEMFKKSGQRKKISSLNANLLYTAIFANTLDFKAKITTSRDLQSADELATSTTLPKDWKNQYYLEVAAGFEKDFIKHLMQDTKIVKLLGNSTLFAQIELWNIETVLKNFQTLFHPENQEEKWIINMVGIKEGRSHIFCNHPLISEALQKCIPGHQNHQFLVTDHVWLRKEILKKLEVMVVPLF